MRRRIDIGILYSRSGGYALIGEACRSGALAAIADVNADPRSAVEFAPVERDPQGSVDRYAPLCEDIFRTSSARHVIGCVTSWSRKEVIPVLEKYGRTLWYACPYEGFEANDHVFYTHACPNQHLVPLLSWVTPRFGANGYLVGSNYIWGWEMNRAARDLIADAGGEVMGERYLALGDTDVDRLVYEIRANKPSFVLNNLIGPSSYAFLTAMAELGRADPRFAPDRCPVLSCNLSECELPALRGAAEGQIVIGPYFARPAEELDWPLCGRKRCLSSFEASGYTSVLMLAQAISADAQAANSGNAAAFFDRSFASPLGAVGIDRSNRHASLPAIVGRVEGDAVTTLKVIDRIQPDPYLSRYDAALAFPRPSLRVVS